MNDRGVAQMGQFDYEAAHATFSRLVEERPDWIVARINLAIATLNRQEEVDERKALEILASVLTEQPDNVRALYTSGVISFHLGDTDSALDFFTKTVELDPQDAYASYFLGQTHLQLQQHQDAQRWLLRSIELDPYLTSGYWAANQASRRLGEVDLAEELVTSYNRLKANPAARTASIAYLKMGPKAEAKSMNLQSSVSLPIPMGEIFGESILLNEVDIKNHGMALFISGTSNFVDLFLAGEETVSWYQAELQKPGLRLRYSIAVNGVHAMLVGDLDNDTYTDLVLCGATGTHWMPIEKATDPDQLVPDLLSEHSCHAAVLIDADHDGDLDVVYSRDRGVYQLTNLRDEGSNFSEVVLMDESNDSTVMSIVASDMDSDRDIDLLLLQESDIAFALRNDRTWNFSPFAGLSEAIAETVASAVAGDIDADGFPDIVYSTPDARVAKVSFDGTKWQKSELGPLKGLLNVEESVLADAVISELALADVTGNGQMELLITSKDYLYAIDLNSLQSIATIATPNLISAIPVYVDERSGPGLLTLSEEGLQIFPPGQGRFDFLAIDPVGERDSSQMRSNSSGIGTRVKLRQGGMWSVQDRIDSHSGPHQSLMPLMFGVGGNESANNVVLEWSDGVFQTELDLSAGAIHRLQETERQLASCPVIFVWDGSEFAFVSDVLGVGGLGFFVSPGTYATPRPIERYLLQPGMLQARNERYAVKIAEPMEETLYLDSGFLEVIDLPMGWSLTIDERMATSEPNPMGRLIAFRNETIPNRATATDDVDITEEILHRDYVAPDPGVLDNRFIGRLAGDYSVTLWFDESIPSHDQVLVADGWIEYPYSQTAFSAWQADADYRPPTLEALNEQGHWTVIAESFGYPAGMPREMAFPLPPLPDRTVALRITTNLEIYWDRLRLVTEEAPPDEMEVQRLVPIDASVQRTGFARRTTGNQRLPHYDYTARSTYWDAKYQEGTYTRYGDALNLVKETDGAVGIIGSGEEIHLEFPLALPQSPSHQRFFILEFRGWARDMDLYTNHGETVEPLPWLEELETDQLKRVRHLHERYNVRFEMGL
ncbi:MAG: tetratricopeptide repeat protein [Gammaproteobacteria bacterium]|nr:tetratricopeptide repeat protein [Gammaproteobacteria bacterium]